MTSHIDPEREAVECAQEILRRRLSQSPLPTPDSHIDEGLTKDFQAELAKEFQGEAFQPFIAISVPSSTTRTGPSSNSRPLRVGVLLSHLFKDQVNHQLINSLELLAKRFVLSSILLPTSKEIDPPVIEAMTNILHVRIIQLPTTRIRGDFAAEDFQFLGRFPQGVLNSMNIVVQSVIRHLRKVSHILLSDVAAPDYDKKYKRQSAGTAFVMRREEEILDAMLMKMEHRRGLIELGCGTGRHTLRLAQRFERAVGYDFSSRMIEVATAKKSGRAASGKRPTFDGPETRVEFLVRDVEMYPPTKERLRFPVDCVLGLFGMGSFVEDLPRTLRNVRTMLEPEGRVAFSFYNKEALTYSFPPPWRHTSLSATLDATREELQVTLPSGQRFFIFCRPYNDRELVDVFGLYFSNLAVTSFPIISGLLPPEYIGRADPRSALQQFFSDADRAIAEKSKQFRGNYFFVTGRKAAFGPELVFPKGVGAPGRDCYEQLLQSLGLKFTVRKHRATRDAADAIGVLDAMGDLGELPYHKAILAFRSGGLEHGHPIPVMLVVNALAKVDRAKASKALGAREGSWRIASPDEVSSIFGSNEFPLPFLGLKPSVEVIVDNGVSLDTDWWTSGGAPDVSFLIQQSASELPKFRRADLALVKGRRGAEKD